MKPKKVILGNGMIAKAFAGSNNLEGGVFASGVSDSKCNSEREYIRESDALIRFINNHRDYKIYYFSSFCVENSKSMYCIHKKQMEEVVMKNCAKFCILRLPQVVGLSTNDTLVRFIVKKLLRSERLIIKKGALRRLIDVSDVVRVCEIIGSKLDDSLMLNLGPEKSLGVEIIVREIAKILNITPTYTLVDGGDKQSSSVLEAIEMLGMNDIIFKENYQIEVLTKYVPEIANQLESNDFI